MLIYTLELDKVTEGVTVAEYTVPSRNHPLIGVSVGNFVRREGEKADPLAKIFSIRDIGVGDTTAHVKAVLKSDPESNKPGRLIGAWSISAESDTDRDQALVYIKTDDPEAKVKLPDSKNYYLQGRLFEGIVTGTEEHTNKYGRTYRNCSRPSVLLVDKDVEYTMYYNVGRDAYTKVFKFDGSNLVIVSNKQKDTRPPKREITVLETKLTDMLYDDYNDTHDHRRNRKKDRGERSRKESRWR